MNDPPPLPTRSSIRSALAGLERSLTSGDAMRPAAERRAAAASERAPGALGDYLARVRDEACAVTDQQVAALLQSGHGDDELFELTICAAYGAARRQLDAGLAAVAEAYEAD